MTRLGVGQVSGVGGRFQATSALRSREAQAAIPVVVLGEFRYGIALSRNRATYEAWLKAHVPHFEVLLPRNFGARFRYSSVGNATNGGRVRTEADQKMSEPRDGSVARAGIASALAFIGAWGAVQIVLPDTAPAWHSAAAGFVILVAAGFVNGLVAGQARGLMAAAVVSTGVYALGLVVVAATLNPFAILAWAVGGQVWVFRVFPALMAGALLGGRLVRAFPEERLPARPANTLVGVLLLLVVALVPTLTAAHARIPVLSTYITLRKDAPYPQPTVARRVQGARLEAANLWRSWTESARRRLGQFRRDRPDRDAEWLAARDAAIAAGREPAGTGRATAVADRLIRTLQRDLALGRHTDAQHTLRLLREFLPGHGAEGLARLGLRDDALAAARHRGGPTWDRIAAFLHLAALSAADGSTADALSLYAEAVTVAEALEPPDADRMREHIAHAQLAAGLPHAAVATAQRLRAAAHQSRVQADLAAASAASGATR